LPPQLERAARILLAGGVVAYPTEAVYGLGCLPLCRDAVLRILAIKQRAWRKGLILIAADVSQLRPLVRLPEGPMRGAVLASWPGPVTWTLRARPGVPRWLSGGRPTLAVRVTAHPLASALCRRAGSALVSTSANRSGHPPIKSAARLRCVLGSAVDYTLAGPLGSSAGPTEIRDGRSGTTLRSA
jgi:L-threonylcarbamoyladenylate synthase